MYHVQAWHKMPKEDCPSRDTQRELAPIHSAHDRWQCWEVAPPPVMVFTVDFVNPVRRIEEILVDVT